MKRTSAVLTLMTPAAPNPCTMRDTVSIISPFDSVQASEATVNSSNPTR
jgi:hypothetical protein